MDLRELPRIHAAELVDWRYELDVDGKSDSDADANTSDDDGETITEKASPRKRHSRAIARLLISRCYSIEATCDTIDACKAFVEHHKRHFGFVERQSIQVLHVTLACLHFGVERKFCRKAAKAFLSCLTRYLLENLKFRLVSTRSNRNNAAGETTISIPKDNEGRERYLEAILRACDLEHTDPQIRRQWNNVSIQVKHFKRWFYILYQLDWPQTQDYIPDNPPTAPTSDDNEDVPPLKKRKLTIIKPFRKDSANLEASRVWLRETVAREIQRAERSGLPLWAVERLSGEFLTESWNFVTGLVTASSKGVLEEFLIQTKAEPTPLPWKDQLEVVQLDDGDSDEVTAPKRPTTKQETEDAIERDDDKEDHAEEDTWRVTYAWTDPKSRLRVILSKLQATPTAKGGLGKRKRGTQ